jgi:cation diffusion facilitator family transporter
VQTAKENFRIQQWITLLSIVLFVAKIVAYYLTNSLAVLTDALESIVNVIAGFIGLYSLYVASKPKDIEHPYGHGKAEFISAAAEGGLIIAAGLLILYETFQNIIDKKPLQQLDDGLYIVAATAIVNYVAGLICVKRGRQNNSLALQASGKHLQIDTLSTLIIIVALVIMLFTRLLWLDKAVAFILGVIVIYNGYKIIRKSVAGIMDEADMELLQKMVEVLNANRKPNWIDLHNLRVIKYGSILHIDCHITVPWYINVMEAHAEVEALISLIKREFGDAIEMFVHTDACLEPSCPICLKEPCDKRLQPLNHRVEWTLENIIADKKHHL